MFKVWQEIALFKLFLVKNYLPRRLLQFHQESLTQRAKFYVPFSDIKYLLNTLNSATDCAQCAVCADLLVRFKENDVTKAGTGYNLQI